ncbi:universal stress protein [Frateuria hangzhouensis]|uniref:universal stress protein n=1 Tax=Frateuria hangzhouensis TaxID=2995589 RepID=UPI0022608CAB|nr:universal stress protein [Frateuria sp. STR12]MCX7515011.1 universal stress protein [Frateuria sp. STR12]
MTDRTTSFEPPCRILLATDLRSHSDRALDRAVQLARQWQATLHVVHVLTLGSDESWPTAPAPSGRQAPTNAAVAERQIRRDLREEVPGLVLHVTEGDPADTILATATREQCDLIVLGTSEAAAHGSLGHVTEYLLRRSPASLLVVRERPHGGYAHVLVGTDFTDESRHGLTAAAGWFPAARLALMHVLDIPYKSLWLDAGRGEQLARMEMATMQSFLADTPLPAEVRAQVQPLVEHGHPEAMLRGYVVEKEADLVVISAFRRGMAFHLLVGGTSRRIVPAIPTDVLLVRAPA